MKQLSLILSIIATCLAGVVLYLHLKEKDALKVAHTAAGSPASATAAFAIAYFDMDSLENNYQYYKDALNSLKTTEDGMNSDLSNMERSYQKKIAEWQQKGNTMSQAEAEAANKEYQQMQQRFVTRKQEMEQKMESLKRDEMGKLRKKLEDFLKDYNKDKRYDYIFSYAPEFMFYKDTVYNITPDLVKGLNEQYKGKN
jgi:outer membrane protein